MNPSHFQDPAWCHALTLAERINVLAASPETTQPGTDIELARRRLQSWQAQTPFQHSPSIFAQRLAADGVSEAAFLDLLGEPVETLHQRLPAQPSWLAGLSQAFLHAEHRTLPSFSEILPGQDLSGFLALAGPLIEQGRERLHCGLQDLIRQQPGLPVETQALEENLLAGLAASLLPILNRTLVLELNVARLEGKLSGVTAAERFQSFLQRLRRPEVALAIFKEYPVLARQLTLRIDQWAATGLDLLQRLSADWPAIQAAFTPTADPGGLMQVTSGIGDRHRGGQAVQVLTFSSGFKLVYKPKSLAVDLHFQELLAWLNARGARPALRILNVLDRGTHGWEEFVAEQGCTSVEEVTRFYERQGSYLALLYVLEATDFHFENIIAAGEHPVLIDLEGLFHARFGAQGSQPVDRVASGLLAHSVLRTGLLPAHFKSGPDMSGLGTAEGQVMPHALPYWEAVGTDEMHLDRKQMTLATGQNRPRLDDAEVNLLDYTPAILSGFTATYRLLMAQRDELLAPAGPLACFTGDEVRVVVRNTRTYMRLLQESFHPDMLRNALERERLFDHLWVGSEQLPVLARVIPSEREDLSNGDVPMFTARPGSRHLWNSAQACQADFLDEPSLVLAQRRLQQLDENDLTRQLWFIRASLATLARELEQTQPAPIRVPEPETPADRAQLLAAARAAGNRLAELAWEDQDEVSWVGLALTEGNWALSPLEEDLYDGLLGVTLFLAYLGTVSGEERYTALAKAALANARRQLQEIRPSLKAVGFSGWGGVIYTLAHLGVLWGQPALLAEAQEIVELLPPLIEQDEALDIMAGSAGCIGGLISLYQAAPSEQALAAIIRCAERLLARAQKLETGLGWHTHVAVLQPLTGFSHGAAGMAWALLEASALTGVERFRSAALDAMAYERSLFSAQAGNWPDLRDFEAYGAGKNTERFMLAWCHGAPGIGLARVCALRLVPEAKLRAELLAEINASLAITLAYGFGSNHSLCHGDLGNLELLLQAGEALDDADVRSRTYRLAAMILESVNQNGWLCGVPLSVETPGLMVGLAGIGYELLRLAEPGRVPSVLTLAPPYSTTGLSTTRGRPGARGRSAC